MRYDKGDSEEKPIENEITACFCWQQKTLDITFIAPPFGGTPEKDLCADWSEAEFNKSLMAMVGDLIPSDLGFSIRVTDSI